MKDKNEIEIIRENCKHKTPCNGCGLVERDCKIGDKHCQFTPSLNALEARIAELEDENADLYEALTIAYLKGKAYENAEKLDAKESEPKACDDCWLMRDFGRYIPAGYCANGKCAKIYNAFAKESEVRK